MHPAQFLVTISKNNNKINSWKCVLIFLTYAPLNVKYYIVPTIAHLKTYPISAGPTHNKVFKKRLRSISASSCAVPPLTNEPTNTNEKQFVCWSFTNHFISSCRTKQKGANWAGQGDWKNDKFFDKWSKQSHLDPWYPWHSSLWSYSMREIESDPRKSTS